MESIRIFVAATPAEWLPQKVLEFSIREKTQCKVELFPLYKFERDYALPKEPRNRPRTPFSFQRFLIPEICGYAGRAIYMDADMQVFKNIEDLWSIPFNGKAIQTVRPASDGRKGQFSVMLMDCAALNWRIDDIVCQLDKGDLTYEQLMYEMRVAPSIGKDISSEWNTLERYENRTSLLHYTDMNIQPWISIKNPLGALWVKCLRRAIAENFITINELQREIDMRHVRPSLITQIESGQDDPGLLGRAQVACDHQFSPPYLKLNSFNARPWSSPWGFLKVAAHKSIGKAKWVADSLFRLRKS